MSFRRDVVGLENFLHPAPTLCSHPYFSLYPILTLLLHPALHPHPVLCLYSVHLNCQTLLYTDLTLFLQYPTYSAACLNDTYLSSLAPD